MGKVGKSNSKISKKSSKKLKEEIEILKEKKNIPECLKKCDAFICTFPKNVYGYSKKIEVLTNNYTKYLSSEDLKEVKVLYEKTYELASKKMKDSIKKDFNEYIGDCGEVTSLGRIKKELVSTFLRKNILESNLSYVVVILQKLNVYRPNGKRIINIYDFIHGIFLSACLIFNLFNVNFLLFITLPFGIYGLITIYNFFDTNLSKKNDNIKARENYNNMIDICENKIKDIKNDIQKINDKIDFLNAQKAGIILKIPESFKEDIMNLYENDEKQISGNILLSEEFETKIKEETTLLYDDIIKEKNSLEEEFEIINLFMNNKLDEKKNNQSRFISMKEIKPINIVIMLFLLILSILSTIIVINNFYEINLKSFVFAIIVGIITMIIYNIKTGKSSSLSDTFNDNLLTTIFNTTLTYDLIYKSITNDLGFVYGFIQMPIIFTLILIGFVMVISFLKYNNLKNKLIK